MSIEIHTFGCRLNTYESELIKQAATQAELENVIIFNSCAVTHEAERQLKQAIRREKRLNPEKKIIVTGCAVQINPEQYAAMPEIDQIIGNTEKTKSISYQASNTNKVLVNDIMAIKEEAHHFPIDGLQSRSRAFMQVQNGCNHRCTYCIIPYGRGNSRSIPVGEIITQAERLVDAGYHEIVLTGVDITDYGLDLPGKPSLGLTVKRILTHVPKLNRLRLSSIDVAEIDDTLFDMLAHEERVMPHIHLSLQSGDNLILKRMKRRHNREQVIKFCQKIKKIRPKTTFGADIIVGFPTETHEMFLNTFNIIHEADLTYLHIFPYSQRPGTPATKMPQVEKTIIKQRAADLRKISEQQLIKHYNSLIGTKAKVVIEQKRHGRAEDFSLIKLDKDLDEGILANVMIKEVINTELIGEIF